MSDWIETPDSDHIAAIQYDDEQQTVSVRFADDGSVYRYLAVPRNVFDQLLQSASKGRFVNIVLRRRYDYVKVE